MIATPPRPSATILSFPSRGALASVKLRDGAKPAAHAQPRPAPVAFGSNWYHEAAILEARDPNRN